MQEFASEIVEITILKNKIVRDFSFLDPQSMVSESAMICGQTQKYGDKVGQYKKSEAKKTVMKFSIKLKIFSDNYNGCVK